MTDELITAIDQANAGMAPPPFGEMVIVIPGAPVSVQSSKSVRDAYIATIKAEVSRFHFILTGQLVLNITWLTPAKSRYETDAKADIDNCLKPIIDAFTGPDGLFINDCQLKGLYICWRHIESESERLRFQFEFDSNQWCEKAGFAFIKLDRGLCSPVNRMWPKSMRKLWVEAMQAGEQQRAKLEQLGASYLALVGMTGGSQPFHVTRTGGFILLTPEEFTSYDDTTST
ncbi:RusA family crossover junction endodeoxyribonuclease [Burkholderia ubonensis]|uniref:RusA family crossover junction endodeoxyribonuclease n=1 Tax=Burkholderia ubonensis TaxID=101571 RepID=UPI0009B46C61|nr:RusA family crossover junction endodeoxyribonuclease [Burkholderia ubonensis]